MKYIINILLISIMFYGCTKDTSTIEPEEDYAKLFPWKGIDKPESAYEDMNIKLCNPEEALENYRYNNYGKDIPDKRTYTVTIECSYKESPPSFTSGISRYEFRYIDEDKEIKSIATNENQSGASYILKSEEIYRKTFKVQSGYPMYLFVNGVGNRFSSVKAKITATSEDGLIVVPILSTEQYQNNVGFDKIKQPFCEYIILP